MNEERLEPSIVQSRFLETCEPPLEEFKIEPFIMVIFGGAGDLSRRKLLPALYKLYLDKRLPEEFSILGFGLPQQSEEQYRKFTEEAVKESASLALDKESLFFGNSIDFFN